MGLIYHLALEANWHEALAADDGYRISSVDRTLEQEGFIHCSFAEQVQGSADRFYQGRHGVLLLSIDTELLDVELRVDPAGSSGQGFPHLYGPLNLEAVVDVTPLATDPDGRVLTGL